MFPINVAAYPTEPVALLGIWAQFLFMIMIYSYPLYKENYAFRFAEHTFIALSMAIMLVINIDSLIRTTLNPR